MLKLQHIGLVSQVLEEIITSNEDESLNDNAAGFTNFGGFLVRIDSKFL